MLHLNAIYQIRLTLKCINCSREKNYGKSDALLYDVCQLAIDTLSVD